MLFLQFVSAMTENIQKISGPVTVTLSNIHDGSVVFTSTVAFLNGNSDAVSAYKTALTTNAQAIFGTAYAVKVDTSSIQDATVANPSKCC